MLLQKKETLEEPMISSKQDQDNDLAMLIASFQHLFLEKEFQRLEFSSTCLYINTPHTIDMIPIITQSLVDRFSTSFKPLRAKHF